MQWQSLEEEILAKILAINKRIESAWSRGAYGINRWNCKHLLVEVTNIDEVTTISVRENMVQQWITLIKIHFHLDHYELLYTFLEIDVEQVRSLDPKNIMGVNA